MREIKFRGKGKDTGDWVYGDLRHQKVGDFYEIDGWTVNTDTIGQFTGLHDKNGKEIYEGDIVATKLNDKIITVGDIQFHCGVFGAEWRYAKKDKTMVGSWGQRHNLRRLDDDIIENIEVIGNIYDNPELIKE